MLVFWGSRLIEHRQVPLSVSLSRAPCLCLQPVTTRLGVSHSDLSGFAPAVHFEYVVSSSAHVDSALGKGLGQLEHRAVCRACSLTDPAPFQNSLALHRGCVMLP